MSRFRLIEKEINKNIQIDEKSNQVLTGWSPNNVRRLIIGFDYALIQYFTTGGKYKKLIEVVDLRRVATKDLEQIQVDPQKYKSILQVLTDGRICSSIEEVVFCSQGYPEAILAQDTNISKLTTGNASLENRFVRLRHVTVVNTNVQNIAPLVERAKGSTTLLLDQLHENRLPNRPILEQHQEDWWKGVSLRPKYYEMDAKKLPEYFEKVKETFQEQERQSKLDTINEKKHRELIQKHLPATINVISKIMQTRTKADKIFRDSPILSKAEWSDVLYDQNLDRGIRLELLKNEVALKAYRKIDYEAILRASKQAGQPSEVQQVVVQLKDYVYQNIFTNEEEYKRESNKFSLHESLQTLQKLTATIYNTQYNIIFLSLTKNLTRNTPKYAEFFLSQLKGDLTNFQYTRPMIEYCNQHLTDGWAKQAMDKIQAREVLVENYGIVVKFQHADQILEALSQEGGV